MWEVSRIILLSILLDLLDLPFGKEIREQLQPLRESPDADAQIVNLLRPGLLRGAVYLEGQCREQTVHLLDGVVVNVRFAGSRAHPR